jgi:hypothetical protein
MVDVFAMLSMVRVISTKAIGGGEGAVDDVGKGVTNGGIEHAIALELTQFAVGVHARVDDENSGLRSCTVLWISCWVEINILVSLPLK